MDIVVLTGGIGGARFLTGVRALARQTAAAVTAIVNVGDDMTLHGLRICPDLDSVMYTLGGGADPQRGWGRRDETFNTKEELAAYGSGPDWFGLGDRDMATHLVRSDMLSAGSGLTEATQRLCLRWSPGVRLLPATDDVLETHVRAQLPDGTWSDLHFQQWWVRYRAQLPTEGFSYRGASCARPAPGVLDALARADLVLLAPSNPVVSIAPILAVPGIRSALEATAAPVVGVSPIIGGAPVRGMADRCLAAIGVECCAGAVGEWYGQRARSGDSGQRATACDSSEQATPGDGDRHGLLDAWLVDPVDADRPGQVERVVHPLWMSDEAATAEIVRAAIAAGQRANTERANTEPARTQPARAQRVTDGSPR